MRSTLEQIRGGHRPHRSLDPKGPTDVEFGLEPTVGRRFYFQTRDKIVGTSPVVSVQEITRDQTRIIHFTTKNSFYELAIYQ